MKRRHATGLIVSLGFYMYACGGSRMNSRSAPPEIPVPKNRETSNERQVTGQEDLEGDDTLDNPQDRSPSSDLKKRALSSRWKGCCPGASIYGGSKRSSSQEKRWTTVAYFKIKSLSFKGSHREENSIKTEKILGGYYHDSSCSKPVTPAELNALGIKDQGDELKTDSIIDLEFTKSGREAKGFHVLYQGAVGSKKEKILQPIKLEFDDKEMTYSIIFEPNPSIGDRDGFVQECTLESME